MTATILENDTEVVVDELAHLDFQPALPCEFVTHSGRGCNERPEWIFRYGCCDFTILVCTLHKDALLNAHTRFKKIIHNKNNGGCGLVMKVQSVEPLS